MALHFAAALRACIVVVALTLATAEAEDRKQPSMMGATREQVLERFGQPRRGMVAGNREVMFFARERVVLRDGVVIEIELLTLDPPPRPLPPPPVVPTPAATPAFEAAPGAAPAAMGPASPPAPGSSGPNPNTANAPALESAPAVAPAPPPPAPEPQFEISFVRSPTGGGASLTDSTPRRSSAPPAPVGPAARVEPVTAPAPVAPPVASARPLVAPAVPSPMPAPRPAPPPVTPPRPAPSALATRPAAVAVASLLPEEEERVMPLADAAVTEADEPAVRAPVAGGESRSAARSRLSEADFPDPAENIFTARTYVISLLVIVGGIGYLLWQRHQRRLELEASTVSRTPFVVPASQGSAARFTTELLAKLEWRRFEELVASYYGKTGVVAERTKAGPRSPVQIRISWKGEPRPFACVRCIPHPPGLIDPQPIQELNEALTKEDIRRGYVVTTGKFNVPARDVAEEKHITLLPGDIFIEKLNALPDVARAELMQEITTGDYTTPSCPKCEAPAVRPEGEATAWRCPQHPDEVIPVRH